MEQWGKGVWWVMYCLFKASAHVWLATALSRRGKCSLLPCAWKEKELEWLMDSTHVLSYQGGQVSRHLKERGKEPCGYGGGAFQVEEIVHAETLIYSAWSSMQRPDLSALSTGLVLSGQPVREWISWIPGLSPFVKSFYPSFPSGKYNWVYICRTRSYLSNSKKGYLILESLK